MYRAGDRLAVLDGPEAGQTLVVAAVRRFAADPGYYLQEGSGLYWPDQVTLAEERTGGNPCGTSCDQRDHDLLKDCDHCRGQCNCEILREIAGDRAAKR
ncbi:hypothetical protein [Streptomyces misionensis]|uniref:hypothetical protein n=1 Tax=Streptomyces misionensis TaxID=67331 RepID=UPI0033F2C210